jgi:NADH-quinone oxidoreductase subunit L
MNGISWSANRVAYLIRGFQSGNVQQYAYVFLIGTFLIVALALSQYINF